MTTEPKAPSSRKGTAAKLDAVTRMVVAQNKCDTAKRALRDQEAEFRFVESDMAKAKAAFDLATVAHREGLAKVNAAKRNLAACEAEAAKLEKIVAANRAKKTAA